MDEIEDDPAFSETGVGYGRPPAHTLFPNQRNANRRGRRREPDRKRITRKVLLSKISVSIGGKQCRVTLLEAVILKVRHESARGHRAASALCDKYRGYSSIHDPEPPPRAVLISPEKLTAEEWEEKYAIYR